MAQQHFSKFWHFEPSLTLCIIALVLFSISTLLHVFQTIKYKQKFFIPFVLGGIFQIVGFIARIFCTQDLHDLASFIVQILFILLAPILYSASIYGLLEKLIKYTEAESLMPIRSALITIIFVTCDVVSFIVQAVGGSMESSSNISMLNAGNTIVLVGLGIQLPFFLFFLFLTGIFDKRTFHQTRKPNQGNWKLLLRVLELSSLLILIRSVYRIVEYGLGYNGYLMNHEGFFYIFDSLMMLLTQILYNVVYPGAILTPLAVSSNKTSSVSVSVPASASAPMGYDLAKVAVESQVNQSPDPACQA